MGFGNFVDKAKEWAGQNPDKADGYVDQGTDQAKERFGHEGQVDTAGDKAKNYLHGDQGQQGDEPAQGEQPPPPQQ